MKSVTQAVTSIVGILIFIGVVKGLNSSDLGGTNVGEIAGSIIDGVADLTIYIVPTIWELFTG